MSLGHIELAKSIQPRYNSERSLLQSTQALGYAFLDSCNMSLEDILLQYDELCVPFKLRIQIAILPSSYFCFRDMESVIAVLAVDILSSKPPAMTRSLDKY